MRTTAITRRVVHQLRRDRRTLGLVFIVPTLTLLLLGYLLREGGTRPTLTVASEGDPVAGAIVGGVVDRFAGLDTLIVAPEQARRRVEEGRAVAAVVVSADDPPQLRLYLDGSEPAVAQRVRALADQLATALASGVPDRPVQTPPVEVVYVRGNEHLDSVDAAAPALIGFFAFFFVFLLTAVSFLRERTGGTLERVMATPVRRHELVGGYVVGFGGFALLQSAVIVAVAVWGLGIDHEGPIVAVFPLVVLLTLVAVTLGIFLSTYARTELQAIQFIPIVILPQGLLSGVIWPVDSLPAWLRAIARALPLTYGVDGLEDLLLGGEAVVSRAVLSDTAALLAFATAFAVLAVTSIRREVA